MEDTEKGKGEKKKISSAPKESQLSRKYLFNIIPELSQQEKLLPLAERNLRRFDNLGLTLNNLAVLVADLGRESCARAEPFLGKCLIARPVLSYPTKIQDFLVSHEITHILLRQEFARRFYEKHPEFREKREGLIRKIINKQPDGLALPDSIRDFLENRIFIETNKFSDMITSEEALLILENILRAAKEEKEVCINGEKLKSARKLPSAENGFFLEFIKKPLSQEEYNRLVTIGVLEAGRSLSISVGNDKLIKESGYKVGFASYRDTIDMEEGVANYLAALLIDMSPTSAMEYLAPNKPNKDKYSKRIISYTLKMRGQYHNNPQEIIKRIKKGQSAYKILFRK